MYRLTVLKILFLFLRFLVHIVLQSGLRETKRMIAEIDKLILVLVRHSYSVCIRVRQNTHGLEWKLIMYIMPMSCLWLLIKK